VTTTYHRGWSLRYFKWAYGYDPLAVSGDVIAPPVIYGEITSSEIVELFPKEYENPNNHSMYETDFDFISSNYELTSLEEIKRFLAANKIDKSGMDSNAGVGKCKWYAVALWGEVIQWRPSICFGWVRVFKKQSGIYRAHAMNIVVENLKRAWLIEPQDDSMVMVKDTDTIITKPYF
jgi:hypothetical protein